MIKAFKIVLIILMIFSLYVPLKDYLNQHTETRYEIQEIQDGTYGIFSKTVSTVPAHHYDVIQFCSDGDVYEFRGKVYITYADVEPYAVVIEYPNMRNGDIVHLCVPMGTVMYQESVGDK